MPDVTRLEARFRTTAGRQQSPEATTRSGYGWPVSPLRRDALGRLEAGPSWDSLVERLIQEAMDDGAFDELPFQGQPLPLDDDSAARDRALAFRMLRNAGMVPPWIETDKEVRSLLEQIERVLARVEGESEPRRRRDRAQIERLVADANRAIARLNSEAPTERQHRRPLELEQVLRRIEGPERANG